MLARRQFDVSFDSAPQIDRYGNLNITAIGDYQKPTSASSDAWRRPTTSLTSSAPS